MEEKQIKFAVEIEQIDFGKYENDEFSIAKVGFLSTRPNSHGLEISEDVLRENAKTVLGKWIVCDIDPLTGDATTHTNNQSIVGVVPTDQEVEFVEDADGYLRAYVVAVISKIYAKDFVELFTRNNERAVSVEMRIATKDGRDMNDIVEQLKIVGVTVLGKTVKPSVPQSDIEIVRFSEFFHTFKEQKMSEQVIKEVEETMSDPDLDNSEGKEETAMNEIEFAAVDIGELWGKLYDALSERYPNGDWGSLYRIAGIYEESNKKFAIIYRQGESANYRLDFTLTEEGLNLADEIVKIEVEFVPTDEVKRFAEPENAAKYTTFELIGDNADEDDKDEDKDEDTDDDADDDAKMSVDELTAKIAELEQAITERDNIIMGKDAIIADLTAYKTAREEQDKAMAVEGLLSKYSKFMDKDTVEQFRSEAAAVKFADIDSWKNKVKASIVDKAIKSDNTETEFTRMSGVVDTKKTPKSLWERVAEMGNK